MFTLLIVILILVLAITVVMFYIIAATFCRLPACLRVGTQPGHGAYSPHASSHTAYYWHSRYCTCYSAIQYPYQLQRKGMYLFYWYAGLEYSTAHTAQDLLHMLILTAPRSDRQRLQAPPLLESGLLETLV